MKLLYITGDNDYAALGFEDSELFKDLKSLYNRAEINDGTLEIHLEEANTTLYITNYEFGTVDPAFVKFITGNIQDYDDSKNHNFYIVEE